MVAFLLSPVCHGATSVGQVVFVKGEAQVIRQGAQKPLALKFNDEIFALDTLITQKGELKVLFTDETLLSLGAHSKLLVTEYVYKPKQSFRNSLFNIVQGTVRAIVSKTSGQLQTSKVTFETPTAVAGIRGTDLGIYVFKAGTQFVCFNGAFDAFNKKTPDQKVLVTTGHYTEVRSASPITPTTITPEVQKHFEVHFEGTSAGDVMGQPGGEGVSDKKEQEEAKALQTQPGAQESGQTSGDSDKQDQTGTGDSTGATATGQGLDSNEPAPGLPGGTENNTPGDDVGGPAGGGQGVSPPQLLPGGVSQPPSDAAGGSSGPVQAPAAGPVEAPVDIPIHFPDNGGGQPQQQPPPPARLPGNNLPNDNPNPNGP